MQEKNDTNVAHNGLKLPMISTGQVQSGPTWVKLADPR